MIVCVCKAVSERRIRTAVKEGAICVRDLTRQFGLGTCCGKCVPDAKLIVTACLNAREDSCVPSGFFPAAASESLA
jgi:bacterioferritin-associated ferredoxin